MTFFVELPIVGEVTLWHHTEDLPAVDHDRTVVKPVATLQRRPDDDDREEATGGLAYRLDGVEYGVKHDVLKQQVVDGVARQA